MPRSRTVEVYLHSPTRLHDVVFNYAKVKLSSFFAFTLSHNTGNDQLLCQHEASPGMAILGLFNYAFNGTSYVT
jgi:hypothetical protein